jgi:hypothetical protein
LSEKENVADTNAAIIEKFEGYFKTARSESPDWPVKAPEPEVDPKAPPAAVPGK